jgi:FkbM family methyltransferase
MGQYTVEVNTSFQIERIMLSGRYEPTTISVLRRHIQQGATCVDIGANVGAITLALAQCVGKNGHIIAYEPGPSNFKKLQKNIQLNHGLLPKVDLYQLGLSNEVGNLFWYEDPSFPGNAGLREHQEEGDIVVSVTTLDTHLLPKIDRVDFIKIDVEGMEQQVLFGGENILKQLRPTIYFETLPETFDVVGEEYFLRIERFLTTLDYQLCRVSRFGHIQKTSILNTSANTLAIHKSKV